MGFLFFCGYAYLARQTLHQWDSEALDLVSA
ncbi:hypothetical protein EYZ11_013178 [Aspergillus tanneri]|uniref:Uncharacterized protein n=1 Tax=Aspergillus tanneri TaxID=1220188 RepID=A0A4V3UMI7_9EURO|nr:hypothetical protein EYZ11_013178 [Aspergillus tanneri]